MAAGEDDGCRLNGYRNLINNVNTFQNISQPVFPTNEDSHIPTPPLKPYFRQAFAPSTPNKTFNHGATNDHR